MNAPLAIRDQLAKVDPYISIGDIRYEFEELDIEIADGFCAGSFGGMAEIDIYADGAFQVDAIWLDTGKLLASRNYEHKRVRLEQSDHPQLWCAIERQLQRRAQGAVEQYIDGMGE